MVTSPGGFVVVSVARTPAPFVCVLAVSAWCLCWLARGGLFLVREFSPGLLSYRGFPWVFRVCGWYYLGWVMWFFELVRFGDASLVRYLLRAGGFGGAPAGAPGGLGCFLVLRTLSDVQI